MKKIFLFLFLGTLVASVRGQQDQQAVSFEGIGALTMSMSKAELEKLLHIKIVLKHIHVDGIYSEDVPVKYKGVDMVISLFRSEDKVAMVEGIFTTNPLFKTAKGIGVGSDAATIIDKYEDQLLIIQPEYENPDGPDYKLSTTKSTITLADIDNYHFGIIFSLVNNKVVSVNVTYTPEFRDRE
ncbi:MAG: hypothetical protein ABI688_10545 [Bacteroidota bacterium]